MANENIIKEYILSTLADEKLKFRIPLYQRKYAWESDDVQILIDDLRTFRDKDKGKEKYFIGNIVVEQKDGYLDIIDGQQRFTTLYLMAKVAQISYYELNYEIRAEDNEFLQSFKYDNNSIIDYKEADSQFKENLETIIKNKEDLKVLLDLCKLTLTILPDGIDIVKYFEVMNNRGKQLEKHQILKAQLLKKISEDKQEDKTNYAKIWDYCSNMNVYIEDSIYYGDLKENEKDIDNNARKPLIDFVNNVNKIPDILSKESINSSSLFINDILKDMKSKETQKNKEEFYIRQEYNSIVKFPIFIMQVFKLFVVQENIEQKKELEKLIINERYLIEFFQNENKEFLFDSEISKKFILFLLKMRILYDYFIFKRDKDENPFLDTLEFADNKFSLKEGMQNKNILMLQLLFNFTSPQYITQDWLPVVLKWLNSNFIKDKAEFYSEYFKFLEYFDRKLALVRLQEKGSIIGTINEYLQNLNIENISIENINLDFILNKGTSTPHYWFYKLDYLLWTDENIWKYNFLKPFARFNYKNLQSNFRLSRLNSIEHVFPQSKKEDWEIDVDSFGNLALISNHMNSALNAQKDIDKRLDIQKQLNNGTIESLKQILIYSKYEEWNQENCKFHKDEMLKILKEDLNHE